MSRWLVVLVTALSGALPRAATAESVTRSEPREVDASAREVFGLQWWRPIVRTGMFRTVNTTFGRPAVSERHRLVLVGTGEGEVQARRLGDGELVWRYVYGVPFETGATVAPASSGEAGAELVLLGARDGNLLALGVRTGELLWQSRLDGEMRAPATLVGGYAVVATSANRVAVVELGTGKVIWSKGRPAPTGLTIGGHSRPTVQDGVVYAAFSDGYVEAYGLEDGQGLWSRPISMSGGEFLDADADPVLAGGRLFVASYTDGIYALDPANGATIWNRPASAVTSLGAHADYVLAGSSDGWVWSLSRADGSPVFRTRVPQGPMSRMTVDRGIAVMSAGDGSLVVLDASTGKPLQATALLGVAAGDPVWTQEHVALVCSAGYVYALELGAPGRVR